MTRKPPAGAGAGDELARSFNAALDAAERDQWTEAANLLMPIVAARPDHHGALHLLGVAAIQTGRPADAADWFARAVKAKPSFVESWANLGLVLYRLGGLVEAETALRQALALRSDYPLALANLGLVLKDLGRAGEAVQALERAVALAPHQAEGWNNLALARQATGDPAGAAQALERAQALAPQSPEVQNNLGNLAKANGHLEAAADHYERAIRLHPTFIEALANLGAVRFLQGRADEAKTAFAAAERAGGGEAMRLRAALALPAIPDSTADIDAARADLRAVIDDLSTRQFTLADPLRQIGMTPFYLAYHAQDDRPLMEALVRLLLKACPSLDVTAPHVHSWQGIAGERIRLGVVSEHLHSHTIGRLFGRLIAALPAYGFELWIFATAKPGDPIQEELAAKADHFAALPFDVKAAQETIAAAHLDLLFYPDIGMTPLTWLLAMARLAPVQAISLGHPNTTGMPSIDAFLSDALMESPAGESHYSERLIRIPSPLTLYSRPDRLEAPTSRAKLGLPDGRLYLCPQSPFKLHPATDTVLLSVLRLDSEGHLVLLSGGDPGLDTRLMRRLERAGPDVVSRVHLVRRLERQDFLALLSHADVMLDPPHYSGGNTTLEALALGVPIVTWPGTFMRSRHCAGFLTLIGLADELIVDDLSAYAPRAVAIATEPAKRQAITRRILANADPLFDNPSSAGHLADALRQLLHEKSSPSRP
ncbi:MAG: tetratricopeptide repeat protein [Rhodospirillales bacterium]|nr:tetratricopeptide repeat protein [Rhodospirillales bacterium]